MKSIIQGKRYDTDTATEIASWSNGASYGHFNWCSETLYLTKAGAFFLHGRGGAMSPYATSSEGGRSRGGGDEIIPMSHSDALSWCEEHHQGPLPR